MYPESAPQPAAQLPRKRPRLYTIYYVLAAFDIMTVSLSLYVIDRITSIYSDSVTENQVWANRLAEYAELSRLAADVNAPGNDVFETRRPADERARMEEALERFRARAATVRADLVDNVTGDQSHDLLSAFTLMDNAVGDMAASSILIFDSIEHADATAAGAQMAEMDRRFAVVNASLQALGAQVRAIQSERFEAQLKRASATRRLELVITALMLVMIGGVTVYGHHLAGQARREAQRTEETVRIRTAELEHTHQQLRLAERLASMGTLAAGLGHDMNNVLFPVRCRLDVLDQADLDEATRAELALIRKSVTYLQRLSDGLRVLARDAHEADAAAFTDLTEWWSEVQPLMKSALPARATLLDEIPVDVPSPAIEPHQLTQAVFNLVVNAGEALHEDGEVRVWAKRGLDPGRVQIGVSDSGEGMTDEVKRRAMDPFFTTKKRSLSTGLGLAIVHAVVNAAGGRIDIESAPKRGTTITLTLPAADRRSNAFPSGAAPQASVSLCDERVASFVTGLLRAHGFDAHRAPVAEPGSRVRLWVCDATEANAAVAARLLDASARAGLVVLGEPGVAWRGIVAAFVNPADGVQALRTAIAEQAAIVREEAA